MKLQDLYKKKNTQHNGIFEWVKPAISFEIFPPDKENQNQALFDEIESLNKFEPAFFSLTCGAAGKNAEKSKAILTKLKEHLNLNVMPHLTCVGSSKSKILESLDFFKNLNIENILALRGDLPENYSQSLDELCYANDLTEFIKKNSNFSIAVAGYPEGHIDCENIHHDIKNLKKKIDAGADVIFTQMFFDNNKFFNYVHLVREEGIDAPIIPGIMPITGILQLQKMTKLARVTLPKALIEQLEKHDNDKDYIKKLGIDFSSYQCQQLIDAEVKGLHFFTLNKSDATAQILDNIL